MCATGGDGANRAGFAPLGPEDAKVVGLGPRYARNLADKVAKGAQLHD